MFWSSGPLLVAAEFLAVLCAAVFAGAAIYVNLVEHPARMSLDTRAAAAQWAPSYQRATLIAALLIGVVVPFTLIVIKPINDQLLASERDLASADMRALLERWGRLHAVRSLLSVLSTVVMLWQLVAPS